MHSVFPTCVGVVKQIVENLAFFSCLASPGGDRTMNLTIKIPLTKVIIHTENGGNRPCSFQEEVQKLM